MIIITRPENSILNYVKQGKTPKEISKLIHKDHSTVSFQIRSMIEKGIIKKEKREQPCRGYNFIYSYTGVPYEVGKQKPVPNPEYWLHDGKVCLTPRQGEIYELLSKGKSRQEIMKELYINGNSINTYYEALIKRGMMRKLDYNKYEIIQRPYKIETMPTTGRPVANKMLLTQDVPQEILEYVKGHYKLYEKKRGALAKKLGITRTLLNQIAIEHKLARGG